MRYSLKWIILAVIVGIALGLVGTAFYLLIRWASYTRAEYPWLIFLLPVGGLAIIGLYHLFRDDSDPGTNLVLSAVHSGADLPPQMAPLIFISTIITHLFGGSSGREGAALQIGGSMANTFAKLLKLDDKDRNILIMCGMSASFSAIFGTPMAATVFSIEVVSVGIMQYAALVPCAVSALTAHAIAHQFIPNMTLFTIKDIPTFNIENALFTGLLAVISAIISILFCILLTRSGELYKKVFPNRYLRIFMGGIFVLIMTVMLGTQQYNGLSVDIIQQSFVAAQPFYVFLLKIVMTALTQGCGYKGGEIVPALVVGASFGSFFAGLFGFSPALCAAIGMGAMFCGVTNSPIASMLICFELFGFKAMPYFLISIALSYMMSGYYGLYSTQKFAYSKYKAEYINRKTKDL